MKAKITYINGSIETIIENDATFKDFCQNFFKKKIYLSMAKEGINLAINTNNVMFVEEIKET
jgi:hypothetical protein